VRSQPPDYLSRPGPVALLGRALALRRGSQQYHLAGTNYLPPTNFTPEEALALIVLCHEMGDRTGLPFLNPARAAAVKLENALPGRMRDQLRELINTLRIQPLPKNPLEGMRPVYDQLIEAVAKRRSVRLRYRSINEGDEIRTRLNPYQVFFSRRSWYVVGRSSLHRATRTFNLGRIAEIEVLDDRYKIPRGFSIERFLRNAWHLIPEPGGDWEVVVRFSKMVAQNVAEVTWHKTQKPTFNKDGTLDFHVTVSGLNEISWWILGYGDQAEVLKPLNSARSSPNASSAWQLCITTHKAATVVAQYVLLTP